MADIEATLSPRAERSLLSLGKVAPRLEPRVFRYAPAAFRHRTRLITGLCLPKVADRQCTLSPRKKIVTVAWSQLSVFNSLVI